MVPNPRGPTLNSVTHSTIPRITDRIRVFVAESNRVATQLMETALQRHRRKFEVQAITSGSSETLRELAKSKPDVALISAGLEDGELAGFRVLQQLRDSKSNTAPVILLDSVDRDLMVDAFRCGAKGVFTRTHSIDTLPKCICAVHAGEVWVTNEQVRVLLELVSRLRPFQAIKPGGMALLSDREREIVCLIAEGMTNDEISEKLRITEHTVRNYLCHIFEKLGLSSRVELVLYALSR